MEQHASDMTPLDFRRVLDALEGAIEHGEGSLTIYGEHGIPLLVLKDASTTETGGAVGWVD